MVDQYLQHLMALISSKNIFASYEFMKNLPPNTPIPNKNNLFSELETKVDAARNLTRTVNRLLKNAAYPKALANLKEAQKLVPDFPNIQVDIDFIEGSMATFQQSLVDAELAARKGEQKRVSELLDTAIKIDESNIAIRKVRKDLQKHMRKRKMRNILLLSLVILTPFLYSGYEEFLFMKGNSQWNLANSYITTQKYQLAKEEMGKIDDTLQGVRFLNQIEKEKLLACVRNMTGSSRFQQGLLGKVLYDGEFIDRTNKEQIDQIALLCEQGQLNVDQDKWPEALTAYQKALKVALIDEVFHKDQIEELRHSIFELRDVIYARYEEEGRQSFRAMVTTADILFKERRWAEAMDSYNQALRFAQENRVSDYDVVSRISLARHEAEMKNSLEEAQAYLAVNKELEAREVLQRIVTLADENGFSSHTASVASRKMIARIDKNIFIGKMNDLEEYAKMMQAENKYDEALAQYQELLEELTVNSEKFQINPADRIKGVHLAMAEISKQQLVTNKYRYLLTAYQNILRESFNLSSNTHLKQPKIVFLKGEDNVLIYKVTALGSQSSGTSAPHTQYEVDYKFDMGTGAWALDGSPTS